MRILSEGQVEKWEEVVFTNRFLRLRLGPPTIDSSAIVLLPRVGRALATRFKGGGLLSGKGVEPAGVGALSLA